MKRVICIDDKPLHPPPYCVPFLLKYGEVYTVSRELEYVYSLVETDAVDPTYTYKKYRFIPLSEIDETQMERNYQKEKV